jgi:adenosylhomocysteine nucleosidase
MRIGVIAALDQEARAFSGCAPRFLGAYDPIVKVAGPGIDNATRAAEELLGDGCEILLSWGLAGGLNPALAPAQLLIGTAAIAGPGERHAADDALHRELLGRLSPLAAVAGSFYTAPHAIASAREKTRLHAAHAADAVDMESAAIARAADRANARFAAIRCVVDPADFDLPVAAEKALDAQGRLRLSVVIFQVVRHPGEIIRLMKLAGWYRAARAKLVDAARALGQ